VAVRFYTALSVSVEVSETLISNGICSLIFVNVVEETIFCDNKSQARNMSTGNINPR
jgi:hypothetical protein